MGEEEKKEARAGGGSRTEVECKRQQRRRRRSLARRGLGKALMKQDAQDGDECETATRGGRVDMGSADMIERLTIA